MFPQRHVAGEKVGMLLGKASNVVGTKNYQVWSCAMLLALEGKNKTGFIDGTCVRSNVDEVLGRQWDRVNAIVLGWILNSIFEELVLGQKFSKRAQIVWDELKKIYDKVDGSFDAFVQLPRCNCHVADDFAKHNQLMKLMQFLMGLNDCYMHIRSNILSRDVLPDVRNAYAIISREESHRVVSSSGTSQRPLNNVNVGNGNRRSNGGSNLANIAAGLIVYSGANEHLTYTNKDFVNVIDLSYLSITVSHPNGTKACVTQVGNMVLNKTLILYDVLVVPEYCVSLMSVHKMARESNLIVAFDESKCFVLPQDLRYKKVVGIGNKIDDLYYFNRKQGIQSNCDKSVCNLFKQILHNRLDHSSDQVLKVLKNDIVLEETNSEFCKICQMAKQTREHFPLSDHKSSVLGELVHLDLWGPYEGFKYFLTIVDDYIRAV
ncbi:ribonuclease H-like domain-containing protein [Tanacetum coccineum]|uniref:Ribonuclease H-like domain-containing protein n=1 Tax=Tanacetum coccineum TaxID=301880 RepID=A0ABQ5EBG1_9ASTR